MIAGGLEAPLENTVSREMWMSKHSRVPHWP